MNRLVNALNSYRTQCERFQTPDHSHQAELVNRFLELAEKGLPTLERTHWEGHFTGSVLIASLELDKVLLTHHRKLDLWLQLGGHADADADLAAVALREGKEESGLENLRFLPLDDIFEMQTESTPIFDLDIHWIPEKKEPGHWHFDVRYLGLADSRQPLVVSEESHALRWIPLSDAYGMAEQWSMHRQFDKLQWVRKHWAQA